MTPGYPTPHARQYVAIGLISAALVAFQLALMQLLSCLQWHHFAYMIISVALLGFGAAGTFLSYAAKGCEKRYEQLFPLLAVITAAGIPGAVVVANLPGIRFDSLLVFADWRHAFRLVATYCIYFLPFFTGAMAIGLSFVRFAGQIGKTYFANLSGSGLGGIVALWLMQVLPPEQLPLPIGAMALAAGLIAFPGKTGWKLRLATATSMAILLALIVYPPKLNPSEYKDIRKTLLLPHARVEYTKNSPHGQVQIVASPVLRFAPGVSLSYTGNFPVRKAVFCNGNWAGSLVPPTASQSMLNFTPQALPYHLAPIRRALLLDAGTGESVLLATSHNVPAIVATEPNAGLFGLMHASFSHQSEVALRQTMARTLLAADTCHYDLIELPVIGSFFGNSGLNAVEPHFELTIEALQQMWERLSEKGYLSLSCWMDYPVRNPYRLLSNVESMLSGEYGPSHSNHMLAIRSWSSLTLLLKKTPFTPEETKRAQIFCDSMQFDSLLLPGHKRVYRGSFNLLQDESFFVNTGQLLSENRNLFIKNQPYRLYPTTDNKPFFFQYLRWSKINQLIRTFGQGHIPFMELGYLLVILTFIQIVLIAALFMIPPAFRRKTAPPRNHWVFVYFSAIGLAYMFIEIIFIQQFTFYFGQPIYATAVTISILLMTSGFGSYYSDKISSGRKMLFLIPLLIAGLLFLYSILLEQTLSSTIGTSPTAKLIIAVPVLGVLGFLLGLPFPLGIRHLSHIRPDDIPRAWAFNGYFSVISSTLAIIVAVESGYNWLLLIAGIMYALAAAASYTLKQKSN